MLQIYISAYIKKKAMKTKSNSTFLFSALITIIYCIQAITCSAALGIDHSELITVPQFQCLAENNYTFSIIRAWRSFGAFDNNAIVTLKNAKQANFKKDNIGVYAFPCFSMGADKSPQKQMEDMLIQLTNSGVQYSSIWIDMETNPSPNCGWSTNYTLNCQFTQKLVQSCKKSNKMVGIYASNYMWNQIMGGTNLCSKFTDLPLWYAHYDGIKSFEDFKSFGGWTVPFIKQYKGSGSVCGVNGLDFNYKGP